MRKSNPGKYTRESEDPWHGRAKLNRSAARAQPCASPSDSALFVSLLSPWPRPTIPPLVSFWPFYLARLCFVPLFALPAFVLAAVFSCPLLSRSRWLRCPARRPYSADIYWLLNFCHITTYTLSSLFTSYGSKPRNWRPCQLKVPR